MANQILAKATANNTSKAVEFKHPTAGTWHLGVLNNSSGKYELLLGNGGAGGPAIAAGSYTGLKCRLVGTTTEYGFSGAAVTVLGTTLPSNAAKMMLLMGQSNEVGIADSELIATTPELAAVTPALLREFQRVKIWNPTSHAWEKLQVGVNNLSWTLPGDHQCYGPELGIAQAWEDLNATEVLYLYKFARSGVGIAYFDPANTQSYYPQIRTEINEAKAALASQGLTPNVVGVSWNQGESDAGDTAYAAKAQALEDGLLADTLTAATTRWAIGEVKTDTVVPAQQAVWAGNNAATHVLIPTASYLTHDGLHYDVRTMFNMGDVDIYNAIFQTNRARRFANAGGTAPAAPTITSFTPTSGAVSSTVVITGTNLTGATAVAINNLAVASFVVNSATQVTATLSGSQTTGTVKVTTPGGTATSTGTFTVTTSAPALPVTLYYQSEPKIAAFPGPWDVAGNVGDGPGGASYLLGADGFRGISFTGTGFRLLHASYGGLSQKYEVYVDGVLYDTVYEATDNSLRAVITVAGLPNAQHHVQVVGRTVYGAYAWLGQVEITGTLETYTGPTTIPARVSAGILGLGTHEQDDPAWLLTGSFGSASNGIEAGGSGLFTLTTGDKGEVYLEAAVDFVFDLVHSTIAGYHTTYTVDVTGLPQATVDISTDAGTSSYAVRYTSPTIPAGKHLLRLTALGMLSIDRIVVRAA
ncbi:IPT/TIG domain-containing protein [Hymenobacter properus]|uniref:IPT/TIG domain-containing protein n=1 Tax=Hymenobacter properus TaxID=2791026 RepID=A0A931BFS7_9BACT|nr:IPT/TIG domain-containing protein [Hymenobacter properus]MBF9140861.1 IPT/TIG domain-containing protein [Hymenobacter properus]MBR7719670.1 IPT/TIG domain-containing protein [Microvirga sp. SRT04]